jgi:hypothetical protein
MLGSYVQVATEHSTSATGVATSATSIRGRGLSAHYKIWWQMVSRCSDKRNKDYVNYGGRGIGVCRRWRESFDAFISDVGVRKSKEFTLDRIDNDGDYEPGNTRWVTRWVQSRNRRNTRTFSIGDKLGSMTIVAMSSDHSQLFLVCWCGSFARRSHKQACSRKDAHLTCDEHINRLSGGKFRKKAPQ